MLELKMMFATKKCDEVCHVYTINYKRSRISQNILRSADNVIAKLTLTCRSE